MKMKNGFTLIELLAVIIILAIISLLAVPVITSIVEDSKESSRRSSVTLVADGVKLQAQTSFYKEGSYPTGEIVLDDVKMSNDNVVCTSQTYNATTGPKLEGCKVGNYDETYCFHDSKVYSGEDCGVSVAITLPMTIKNLVLAKYPELEIDPINGGCKNYTGNNYSLYGGCYLYNAYENDKKESIKGILNALYRKIEDENFYDYTYHLYTLTNYGYSNRGKAKITVNDMANYVFDTDFFDINYSSCDQESFENWFNNYKAFKDDGTFDIDKFEGIFRRYMKSKNPLKILTNKELFVVYLEAMGENSSDYFNPDGTLNQAALKHLLISRSLQSEMASPQKGDFYENVNDLGYEYDDVQPLIFNSDGTFNETKFNDWILEASVTSENLARANEAIANLQQGFFYVLSNRYEITESDARERFLRENGSFDEAEFNEWYIDYMDGEGEFQNYYDNLLTLKDKFYTDMSDEGFDETQVNARFMNGNGTLNETAYNSWYAQKLIDDGTVAASRETVLAARERFYNFMVGDPINLTESQVNSMFIHNGVFNDEEFETWYIDFSTSIGQSMTREMLDQALEYNGCETLFEIIAGASSVVVFADDGLTDLEMANAIIASYPNGSAYEHVYDISSIEVFGTEVLTKQEIVNKELERGGFSSVFESIYGYNCDYVFGYKTDKEKMEFIISSVPSYIQNFANADASTIFATTDEEDLNNFMSFNGYGDYYSAFWGGMGYDVSTLLPINEFYSETANSKYKEAIKDILVDDPDVESAVTIIKDDNIVNQYNTEIRSLYQFIVEQYNSYINAEFDTVFEAITGKTYQEYFDMFKQGSYLSYGGYEWKVLGINEDGNVKISAANSVGEQPINESGEQVAFEDTSLYAYLNDFYDNLPQKEIIADTPIATSIPQEDYDSILFSDGKYLGEEYIKNKKIILADPLAIYMTSLLDGNRLKSDLYTINGTIGTLNDLYTWSQNIGIPYPPTNEYTLEASASTLTHNYNVFPTISIMADTIIDSGSGIPTDSYKLSVSKTASTPVIVFGSETLSSYGIYNKDTFVKLSAKYGNSYKYCTGTEECEPSVLVNNASGAVLISTNSLNNYVCAIPYNASNVAGEKVCNIYRIDKQVPMITLNGQSFSSFSNDPISLVDVTFGESGGKTNCSKIEVGENRVNVACTAAGYNNKKTTLYFAMLQDGNNVTANMELPYVSADTSGANAPKLFDNMIPIYHDGTNWVYSDGSIWYNYSNKEWANAVVLNSGVSKHPGDIINEDEIALWYVWIPRFTYSYISSGHTNIVFETGTNTSGTIRCPKKGETDPFGSYCSDTINGSIIEYGSTYTPSAFTFGDTKLTGLWIGKFENGTTKDECSYTKYGSEMYTCNITDRVLIKPNIPMWTGANMSHFYTAIKNISANYNINADSHLAKTTEINTVGILQSSYNLYYYNTGERLFSSLDYVYKNVAGPNFDNSLGFSYSTSGNIYGVYVNDSHPMEMELSENYNGSFMKASSGFKSDIDSKYYDTSASSDYFISDGMGNSSTSSRSVLTDR